MINFDHFMVCHNAIFDAVWRGSWYRKRVRFGIALGDQSGQLSEHDCRDERPDALCAARSIRILVFQGLTDRHRRRVEALFETGQAWSVVTFAACSERRLKRMHPTRRATDERQD